MIEVKDVHHSYGSSEVIKGVSLIIKESSITALVGPNGSGKTTLAKIIAGIIKPQKGKVFVDGLDTSTAKQKEIIKKIGMVFQNPDYQLFSTSVLDEVAFALRNLGYSDEEAKEKALRSLKAFNLLEYAEKPPLALSGGEKKRLTFSIVSAWDPKYIIFDEPTVGQDSSSLRVLSNVINGLVSEGKGVIITSHDVEFLWSFNPYTFLIYEGKIVYEGYMKEMFYSLDDLEKYHLVEPQLSLISKSLKLKDPALRVEELIDEVKNVFSSKSFHF